MATLRRKKAEPFSVFQRDPGPWPPILLNWMATLAIIMVFGLVMLFSASYTTGYLRFGDSFHYIKSQLLCTVLGLGMMFLFSYFDHRFLRRMVKLGYVVCLILLVLVLFSSPINGCRRWISFGGLTLQASEVAKFEMILLTADIAAKTPQVKFGEMPLRKWVHHSIVVELIRPILWLVPVLILLVLEPHMSGILLTTAIVGTILANFESSSIAVLGLVIPVAVKSMAGSTAVLANSISLGVLSACLVVMCASPFHIGGALILSEAEDYDKTFRHLLWWVLALTLIMPFLTFLL